MTSEDLAHYLVAYRIDGGPEQMEPCAVDSDTPAEYFPVMIAVKRLGTQTAARRVDVTWHAEVERGSLAQVELAAHTALTAALEALERHHATGLKDPEKVAEKVRAAHDAIRAITVH